MGLQSWQAARQLLCGSKHQSLPAVQSDIRREQRQIDKAIRDNDRLEKTAQKQIKEAAKRSDMTTAKVRLRSTAPAPVSCLHSLIALLKMAARRKYWQASAKWHHPRPSSPRGCTCYCLQLLAKELVHTRKATTRLYTNKAHMMNMSAQLTEQLGIAKVAGTLNKSTVVSMGQALRWSCLVADTAAAAVS